MPDCSMKKQSGACIIRRHFTASGTSMLDGRELFATKVVGMVVLVNRDLCGFAVKSANALAAGAKAVWFCGATRTNRDPAFCLPRLRSA